MFDRDKLKIAISPAAVQKEFFLKKKKQQQARRERKQKHRHMLYTIHRPQHPQKPVLHRL